MSNDVMHDVGGSADVMHDVVDDVMHDVTADDINDVSNNGHLPVELWTEEGLSTAASGIGKPLYPDAITRACTRLDFAWVCVMLDVSSNLPKHIIIMTPDEEGGETPCKIDVEYEWIPPKCTSCLTLGYSAKDCEIHKSSRPIKPPVTVYIPKTGPARPPPVQDQKERIPPCRGIDKQRDGREYSFVTGD
ncbi:uncharacterized protein LOC105159296 [Sesamum indicum]|uniref:Uncharacterized protein LOC105159296 n=1 Tax=Sesamum indicum TaxID=4182 RepID=A0A6I9SYC2_SESIN|nr:uncharacterized protein LOC105159296 [Sesamum indicum]